MADTTLSSSSQRTAPASVTQVFKIATISSVQILVLVIAGASGFIVSLLGLIIPDSLKGKPSTSRRSRNRSTSPTASLSSRRSTSPSSLRRGAGKESFTHPNHLKNAGSTSSSSVTTDTAKAWPMSRGNSATSTSTVPELGGGHSTSDASTSCSSSISDAARIHTSHTLSHPHHHHHHHGLSANALYEGIVNRCKARKVSNQTCKKHDTNTVPTTTINEEKSISRRASISTSSSSPRPSHENVRSRLSSLISPHSTHSSGDGHTPSKRHSLDGLIINEVGQKSPTLLDESNRSATLPDATSATTTTSSGTSRISPVDKHGAKPPFLSRMFTFSSSSSSSSSSIDLKSASSASSSSSLPDATSSTTSSKGSSAAISTVTDASISEVDRPRARRLSTRLVSFRSSNNNTTSSKSHRAISESENSHPASLLEESTTQQQDANIEGMMHSPPQTPRLGSLPPASAAWTPGSNASPLRSPLSKRSFFGISNNSPSKNNASSSSPSGGNTLTPRSNNAQTQNARRVSPNGKVERPTLGRRSASDTHTTTGSAGTAVSSYSWKNWMTSSPGKVQRRGTVSVSSAGHPVILSTSIKERGCENPVLGQGLPPSSTRAGGQSKHVRHASDHTAALSSVKGGRSLPLASMSPQQAQNRPRQSVSYRALSYAPPPSHAVLIPVSSTGATYSTNNMQRYQVNQNNAQQQQQRTASSSKAFVPYHPFLDERYHESSLDLSGTSGLTMEVHFNGSDHQQH